MYLLSQKSLLLFKLIKYLSKNKTINKALWCFTKTFHDVISTNLTNFCIHYTHIGTYHEIKRYPSIPSCTYSFENKPSIPYLHQWFQTKGWRGHFAISRGIFGCHNWNLEVGDACYWHVVGRGKGCCLTSCNVLRKPQERFIQLKMSVVPRLGDSTLHSEHSV